MEIERDVRTKFSGGERMVNEIRKQWCSKHPTLPSTGPALMQQLYRIRKRKEVNPSAEARCTSPEVTVESSPAQEAPAVGTEQVADHQTPERWQEKVSEALRPLQRKRPGDMSGRKRQSIKGRTLDPHILGQIDRAMIAVWEGVAEGERTLWMLNSLMYAGAQVGRDASTEWTEQRQNQTETDPDPDPTDPDDPETFLADHDARKSDKCSSQKGGERREKLLEKVRKARQRMGWLEAEMARVSGRKKPPTRKQLRR